MCRSKFNNKMHHPILSRQTPNCMCTVSLHTYAGENCVSTTFIKSLFFSNSICVPDLQVLGWTLPSCPPSEAKPAKGQLDRLVPPKAQEGPGRGDLKEEDQEDSQVPTRCCWRYSSGHHGQEKPEARSQEGAERAGHPVNNYLIFGQSLHLFLVP